MIIDIGPNLTNALNGFFTAIAFIVICSRAIDKWDGTIKFLKKDERLK